MRRFAAFLLFVQLLIGSIGWAHVHARAPKDASIDRALATTTIARVPDRTIESSKPMAPVEPVVVGTASFERTNVDRAIVSRDESRITRAPSARGPPPHA